MAAYQSGMTSSEDEDEQTAGVVPGYHMQTTAGTRVVARVSDVGVMQAVVGCTYRS